MSTMLGIKGVDMVKNVYDARDGMLKGFYSFDFNTTSLNWWMETATAGGRATPEHGNATVLTGGYLLR
jgi:hypothetical protein